jgi:hypothetical protein
MKSKANPERKKRGGSSCAAPLLGAVEPTSRGFDRIDFKDHYGVECSIQASSLAIYGKPGTSALWLGCNDANPRVLVPGQSWQPVKMPADYLADTRMHLNREQVAALIAHLQSWLDTDSLAVAPNDPSSPATPGSAAASVKQ